VPLQLRLRCRKEISKAALRDLLVVAEDFLRLARTSHVEIEKRLSLQA